MRWRTRSGRLRLSCQIGRGLRGRRRSSPPRRHAVRTAGTRTAPGSPASPARASDCASRSASAPTTRAAASANVGTPLPHRLPASGSPPRARLPGWRTPGSAPPSARPEGTRRDRVRIAAHRSRDAGSSVGSQTGRPASTVPAHRSSGRLGDGAHEGGRERVLRVPTAGFGSSLFLRVWHYRPLIPPLNGGSLILRRTVRTRFSGQRVEGNTLIYNELLTGLDVYGRLWTMSIWWTPPPPSFHSERFQADPATSPKNTPNPGLSCTSTRLDPPVFR